MNYKLSIIVPAIRDYNWKRLYNSIDQCCKYEFELILIGPHDLPEELKDRKDIVCIKDYGSPARCMNLGVTYATGDLITWSADDGIAISPEHFNEAVQKSFNNIQKGKKYILTTKYYEATQTIQPDSYYDLCKAYPSSPFIDLNWKILNTAFMSREYYMEIGGCDAVNFSVSCMTLADLSVRTQRDGAKVELYPHPIWEFDWSPGSIEHLPIENAQNNEDWPRYRELHNTDKDRIKIDFNNYQQSPEIWKHRFPC